MFVVYFNDNVFQRFSPFSGVASDFQIHMVNHENKCMSSNRVSVSRTLGALKCFVSNFPVNIPNFGPEQIDSIQYHVEAKMFSQTNKQIYSELLLDTDSEFTLNVLVSREEEFKNSHLGNTGFQEHITFESKFNAANLKHLLVDVLSLALDSEGEKTECVSNVNSSLMTVGLVL